MNGSVDRAILVLASRTWHETQDGPPELLHLVDRPFLHHVVESIATLGCTEIDVVMDRWPERVREALGDGSRWGVTVRYHAVPDAHHPLPRLKALDPPGGSDADQRVLLAVGHVLPQVEGLLEGEVQDHGWAVLPWELLRSVPDALSLTELPAWLSAKGYSFRAGGVSLSLGVDTPAALLESTRQVLQGRWQGLLSTGRPREDGVRVAWSARIHPGATIVGPTFLGEQCWVGDGAVVGPNAVVGAGAIVDLGATVSDALIEPGSYVGQDLTVSTSVVDGRWLADARLGVGVTVTDPLMLAEIGGQRSGSRVAIGLQRLAAALAFTVLSPVVLGTALTLRLTRPGPVLYRPTVDRGIGAVRSSGGLGRREARLVTFDPNFGSRQGRPQSRGGFSDLLLRVFPGLASVAMGHLTVVGVEPRPGHAVEGLPAPWRELYRKGRPGLITESDANPVLREDADALFASEAYLVAGSGIVERAKIFGRYLLGVVARGNVPQAS